MSMCATEYSYWTSTIMPPDQSRAQLSRITEGMFSLLGGVTSFPSPKRPPTTFHAFLLIGLIIIGCSTPNSARAVVSEPLLTTSGMTCMELEKVVRASYLREGCIPYEISTTPTRYFVEYLCKEDLVEPRRFRWGLTWSKPQTAPDDWCFTQQDTCRYQVGRSLYITTLRQKQKREKCEEVK